MSPDESGIFLSDTSSTYPFLAIDRGNTRLKCTLLPGRNNKDGLFQPEVKVFEDDDAEGMLEWVEALGDRGEMGCAIAAVGVVDTRMIESLRRTMGERFLVITRSTPLPILMEYATPGTLGVDRKATACAAAARFPGEDVLVVDAGTALTLDWVSADGVFKGGNISPGLRMRLKALHEHTAKLPLLDTVDLRKREMRKLGEDTNTAILGGCARGLLDEVAMAYLRLERPDCRIVLTGGDAPLIADFLPEALDVAGCTSYKINYLPHLLAEGMREIYRHHENEF